MRVDKNSTWCSGLRILRPLPCQCGPPNISVPLSCGAVCLAQSTACWNRFSWQNAGMFGTGRASRPLHAHIIHFWLWSRVSLRFILFKTHVNRVSVETCSNSTCSTFRAEHFNHHSSWLWYIRLQFGCVNNSQPYVFNLVAFISTSGLPVPLASALVAKFVRRWIWCIGSRVCQANSFEWKCFFQDFHMEKCCKMSKAAAVAPGNSIPKGFLSTDQAPFCTAKWTSVAIHSRYQWPRRGRSFKIFENSSCTVGIEMLNIVKWC